MSKVPVKKSVEELEARILELEERADELEEELGAHEEADRRRAIAKEWGWQDIRKYEKDPYGLPVPRLQMVMLAEGDGTQNWEVSLVCDSFSLVEVIPLSASRAQGRKDCLVPDNPEFSVEECMFFPGLWVTLNRFHEQLSLPSFVIFREHQFSFHPKINEGCGITLKRILEEDKEALHVIPRARSAP